MNKKIMNKLMRAAKITQELNEYGLVNIYPTTGDIHITEELFLRLSEGRAVTLTKRNNEEYPYKYSFEEESHKIFCITEGLMEHE